MRKNGGASIVGLILIILLAGAALWLGVAALVQNGAYRREAKVTYTPSLAPGRADVTENPALPTSTPTPCILRLNVVGTEVKQLQQRLLELGYYAGAVDGQFGGGTYNAVTAFQTQHGLKADGIAGEQTLEALYSSAAQTYVPAATPAPTQYVSAANAGANASAAGMTDAPVGAAAVTSLLSTGSQGEEVKALQAQLKALGYYSGVVDGDFGKGTKAAVRLFQSQNKLDADGIAGAKTIAVLFSGQAVRMVATPTPETIRVIADAMPLLVNKEHPVQKDFVPDDLVSVASVIDGDLLKVKYEGTQGVRAALEALRELLSDAKAAGVTNWQMSAGYRSYADQESIFNSYVQQYIDEGKSRQNAISRTKLTVADPGASEHHTGLAFDLSVPGTSSFKYTEQCKWLHAHCWEYGFIIRYTDEKQDITGFMGEEWHIRYVGTEHSLTIRDKGWCLEEYLQYAAL